MAAVLTDLALVRLAGRQVRRGALVLALAAGAYMGLEVASYEKAYPHGINGEQFAVFLDNPAARMLQGVPRGLDTAVGFAAWDGGWLLLLIVALWALLATTRITRGDEDTGRTELALAAPVSSRRALLWQLLVLAAGSLLVGVGITVSFVLSGGKALASTYFGLAVVLVAWTFVGVAAVMAQVLGVRRRAAGASAGVLVVAVLARMVANSSDDRSWVGWMTPTGWIERLQPFGEPDLAVLWVAVPVPLVLMALAVFLRGRRDTDGALLTLSERRRPRLWFLGGPLRFGWRTNLGVLVGWILGLGAYAFMLGSLLDAMIKWIAEDEDYQRLMRDFGLGAALTGAGFLAVMGAIFALAVALYAVWRLGAVHGEEEAGRLENVLSRPVSRAQWLLGHLGLALLGAALLFAACSLLLWAGVRSSGADTPGLMDGVKALLNGSSVVLLVTGVATLVYGVAPRLTVAVPVSLTVAAYILSLLGPALAWPQWVVDLSPFSHLTLVPVEPFALGPALWMSGLGVVAGAIGLVAFGRRDATPA